MCFGSEALSLNFGCSVQKHQAHPKLFLCRRSFCLQMQVISVLRLRADPNAVIRSRTGLIWHAAPAGRLVSTRSPEMRFASRQSANTNLPAAGTRERSAPAILNTNVLRKACLSWTPAALNLQECHFHVVAELSKTCLHWHRSLSLLWWVCLFSRNKTRDSSEQRCDVSRVWCWSVSDGQVR